MRCGSSLSAATPRFSLTCPISLSDGRAPAAQPETLSWRQPYSFRQNLKFDSFLLVCFFVCLFFQIKRSPNRTRAARNGALCVLASSPCRERSIRRYKRKIEGTNSRCHPTQPCNCKEARGQGEKRERKKKKKRGAECVPVLDPPCLSQRWQTLHRSLAIRGGGRRRGGGGKNQPHETICKGRKHGPSSRQRPPRGSAHRGPARRHPRAGLPLTLPMASRRAAPPPPRRPRLPTYPERDPELSYQEDSVSGPDTLRRAGLPRLGFTRHLRFGRVCAKPSPWVATAYTGSTASLTAGGYATVTGEGGGGGREGMPETKVWNGHTRGAIEAIDI